MEPEQLSELLAEEPYREAIGVLEMISKTPEDYQYYEDRLKFLRDEQAKLADARQEGLEQGREQGLEQGREEGKLAGRIQVLQELLEEPVTPDSELRGVSVEMNKRGQVSFSTSRFSSSPTYSTSAASTLGLLTSQTESMTPV